MKNVFPLTNIVAIRNYLLCELLLKRYIPTLCSTDSWTECLALWIWFTSTVTVCRPAVLIDVSTRISSSPVPTTRCPFAINNSVSMWSAPSKAKYFGNANSGYFHWITLQRTYISWSEQSIVVTCWEFKVFAHSVQSFNR